MSGNDLPFLGDDSSDAPQPRIASTGSFPTKPYAEWIWRVLAFIVDVAPVVVLFLFALKATDTFTTSQVVQVPGQFGGVEFTTTQIETSITPFGYLLALLLLAGAGFVWFWNKGYYEGTTGKSVGKQLTGLETVGIDTEAPIGATRGLVRALLLIIDFAICYIGVLWPLWDADRQCLISDKATKTVVYKRQS